MGPASAKFDPEMEDKDRQNPIQTAAILAAADARDRAETSAPETTGKLIAATFEHDTARAIGASPPGFRRESRDCVGGRRYWRSVC